jgi:hypothetical protein
LKIDNNLSKKLIYLYLYFFIVSNQSKKLVLSKIGAPPSNVFFVLAAAA